MQANAFNLNLKSNMDINLVMNARQEPQVSSRMDISLLLNPAADAMEIDSCSTRSPSDAGSEPSSLSHTQFGAIHRPPPQEAQPRQQLPSLKSVIPNLGPHFEIRSRELENYCYRMAMLELQNKFVYRSGENRPNGSISPPSHQPLHYHDASFPSRQYCRSEPSLSPNSPRTQRCAILRRASHCSSHVPFLRVVTEKRGWQRPVAACEDRTRSPQREHKRKTPHSNKPYTTEQVDWIRYHKVDRKMCDKEALPLFWEQFPDRYMPGSTQQTISSRYYRDNWVPLLDANGHPVIDEKGKLVQHGAKVRDRNTPEGKEKDIPCTLVDKHPWRLVAYTDWKSAVLDEDMERAKQILNGNDPTDPFGKKEAWRKILREVEHLRN